MLAGARSRERLWRCVAEAKNLDHRHLCERDALRMRAPLVGAAQLRAAYAALRERILERLRIPRRDRVRNRSGIIVAFQKRQGAFPRAEPAVQMDPSIVARSVERGRGLAASIERRALIAQVCERHERRRGGAYVHFDTLRTPA